MAIASADATHVRTVLLALLLAGYAATIVGVGGAGGERGFDPLQRQGRQVEAAIETGRFAEALPLAQELRRAHPADLTILYWLGEIHRGIGDAAAEAAAWQEYARASPTPYEACPALPIALTTIGDAAGAQQAYESCAAWAPDDPERLVDLAAALARRGDVERARAAYERVLAVDPGDPRIAGRIAALADGGTR